MSDHDRTTPIPDEPAIPMSDFVGDMFGSDIPTMDEVAAVIAERGRWGDPPRYVPCGVCNWPLFTGDERCPACGDIR